MQTQKQAHAKIQKKKKSVRSVRKASIIAGFAPGPCPTIVLLRGAISCLSVASFHLRMTHDVIYRMPIDSRTRSAFISFFIFYPPVDG